MYDFLCFLHTSENFYRVPNFQIWCSFENMYKKTSIWLIWTLYSNTLNWDRLGVHSSHFFPRFELMDFLLGTFFFGFAFRFFFLTQTFFFGFTFQFWKRFDTIWYIIFSVVRKSILHHLKYRDFSHIVSLKFDQIEYTVSFQIAALPNNGKKKID